MLHPCLLGMKGTLRENPNPGWFSLLYLRGYLQLLVKVNFTSVRSQGYSLVMNSFIFSGFSEEST